MQFNLLIGGVILCCSIVAGVGAFLLCRKAMAAYDHMQRARLAGAIQRDMAARQARMTKFSMTQFAGTKASDRRW